MSVLETSRPPIIFLLHLCNTMVYMTNNNVETYTTKICNFFQAVTQCVKNAWDMGQEVRTTFNRHVCIVYTRRTLSRECPRLGQVWTPPDKTGNGVLS